MVLSVAQIRGHGSSQFRSCSHSVDVSPPTTQHIATNIGRYRQAKSKAACHRGVTGDLLVTTLYHTSLKFVRGRPFVKRVLRTSTGFPVVHTFSSDCIQPYAAMRRMPPLMPHYSRPEHHASMASRSTRKQCCIFSPLRFSPLSTQPNCKPPPATPLLMID